MKRKFLAVGAATALLVAGGSVAFASIPDAQGVIHGCRSNLLHTVTIMDTATQTSCGAGSTEVDWSKTGPQGPQGPIGATGATGPQGEQGPAGENSSDSFYIASSTAHYAAFHPSEFDIPTSCNSGDVAVSSGYHASGLGGMAITQSEQSSSDKSQWLMHVSASGVIASGGDFTTSIVCLSVN